MTITEKMHGRVTVVSLKGNLMGEPETTALRETIYRLTERDEKQVVLDLGDQKAINSTGLGALVAAVTRCESEVALCAWRGRRTRHTYL